MRSHISGILAFARCSCSSSFAWRMREFFTGVNKILDTSSSNDNRLEHEVHGLIEEFGLETNGLGGPSSNLLWQMAGPRNNLTSQGFCMTISGLLWKTVGMRNHFESQDFLEG
eukprot:CAMPEP_0172750940 /NCGR_PEP_ID=MMETSP1074-20121228/150583_1 /TAXON_ID=2916 /ORGANISM="Ceratium fusus, Strain PA161109" /LENGTH=112 /DNA_ID=CAMNT_0013583157 /DNA_START=298 /DNA_END=634 /DNA_ORIENTATION=+